MQLKSHFVLLQYAYLYNIFMLINAKALSGDRVSTVRTTEFSNVVSIGKADPGSRYSHFCTGALVSKRDILTAAHCLQNHNFQEFRIKIGSNDVRMGIMYVPLFWIDYDQWATVNNRQLDSSYNDVIMIRLIQDIYYDVEPLALSNERYEELVNHKVTIAGWGKRIDGTRPNIMETATVKIKDTELCKSKVQEAAGNKAEETSGSSTSSHQLTNLKFFCTAARPYVLIQPGDNGGPVIHRKKIIGINQATYPFPHLDFHPDKVNVHTSIYTFREFINDFIEN